MSNLVLKRAVDLTLVMLTIPFWLPLLAFVAVLVRMNLGAPIFFRQPRPGYREQIFELVKFRTMRDLRDDRGNLLSDTERLTPFGCWLRSTSLDEIPELLNVLRGEMSLVGPRPLLVQYLGRYSPLQRRRHEVPPGLTGLAQIRGRNAISWDEKFAWDIAYVETHSLLMDVKILVLTVVAVFNRRGINASGEATMPEFNPESLGEGDQRR